MDRPDEVSQQATDPWPSQQGAQGVGSPPQTPTPQQAAAYPPPGPWQQPGPPVGWAPPQKPYPYWQGYSATQQPRRSNTLIIVVVVVAILFVVVVVPLLALMLLSGQIATILSSIGQNLNSPPP